MTTTPWTTIALLGFSLGLGGVNLGGCAATEPMPGHNHPADAAVDNDTDTDGSRPRVKLEVWRLSIAGAT